MTSNTTNIPVSYGINWAGLRAWFGRGFDAYVARRSRTDRIQALEAMSDAELATLGIRRNQIVQYVFRDLYWG
jgi:uncharacterized protein YjiS (DUF1127 family)